MLREEILLRLSPEWQARFSGAEASYDRDWIQEADVLQSELVARWSSQTGIDRDRLLFALRTQESETVFPFWRFFNRARSGYLVLGQEAPDCDLTVLLNPGSNDLSTTATLSSLLEGREKTMLVASSVS